MDPKSFQQQVEQWAEIRFVKTAKHPGFRNADEPPVIYRAGKPVKIDLKLNQTWAIEVKKMKPQQCVDCGKMVKNRVVNIRRCSSPEPHWRENCNLCKMTRDPDTGLFSISNQKVEKYFAMKRCEK